VAVSFIDGGTRRKPQTTDKLYHIGRDHIVVGFTTTYAISVYHHWCCEFGYRSGKGVQHYVIKFVSGLWFSPGSSINKTDRHDITEILLKVALNTITLILTYEWMFVFTKCFYLHVFCFFGIVQVQSIMKKILHNKTSSCELLKPILIRKNKIHVNKNTWWKQTFIQMLI
jgi:hypothetical protein